MVSGEIFAFESKCDDLRMITLLKIYSGWQIVKFSIKLKTNKNFFFSSNIPGQQAEWLARAADRALAGRGHLGHDLPGPGTAGRQRCRRESSPAAALTDLRVQGLRRHVRRPDEHVRAGGERHQDQLHRRAVLHPSKV